MVDRELIHRKVRLLELNALHIKKMGLTSYAAFKKDYAIQKATEKILQEMIETCIDIGKHLISDQELRSPDDYRDVFAVLAEEKILAHPMTETMQRMVGFRNVVVHLYEDIDLPTVFAAATTRLGDFDMFVKEILRYVRKQK